LRPLFLVWLFCMLLTASTELGTNQWIGEMMKGVGIANGILILAWISVIMLVGRTFAGPVIHKLTPSGMLVASAVISTIGLVALSQAKTVGMAYLTSAIFAVGVCYFWPTMLGVTSERFPKGGALLMGLVGATGMASAGFAQPAMAWLVDHFGTGGALLRAAILPAILVIIFTAFYLSYRAKGGYKAEQLSARAE
jgi:MFS family permease